MTTVTVVTVTASVTARPPRDAASGTIPFNHWCLNPRASYLCRHAYFQARHGNRVTLYADAISDPERLPPIKLARGLAFKCESTWGDMYADLCDAKAFIYITGARP